MNEHQRETAFLKRCIGYDTTAERDTLEQGITLLQRNQRCVRRAVWLMTLLAFVATAGLCYRLVLMDHFQNLTYAATDGLVKVMCVLGMGSTFCLVAFLGLGRHYHRELNRRREECRQLAIRMLELHLGKTARGLPVAPDPVAVPTPALIKLAAETLAPAELKQIIQEH